jgi:hypothetical protein
MDDGFSWGECRGLFFFGDRRKLRSQDIKKLMT